MVGKNKKKSKKNGKKFTAKEGLNIYRVTLPAVTAVFALTEEEVLSMRDSLYSSDALERAVIEAYSDSVNQSAYDVKIENLTEALDGEDFDHVYNSPFEFAVVNDFIVDDDADNFNEMIETKIRQLEKQTAMFEGMKR